MPLKGIHCPPILSLRVYAERCASFATRHRIAVLAGGGKNPGAGARRTGRLPRHRRHRRAGQAFTARLLKIANSPYYGQIRAVTTVSQATPAPHKMLQRQVRPAMPKMRRFIRQAHRNAGVTMGSDLVSTRIGSSFFQPCRRQRARWISYCRASLSILITTARTIPDQTTERQRRLA